MSDGSTSSSSTATAAYARIYEEQQPRLVAYARSLTRNTHAAEDLVAEAHFRVWRRLAAGHEIDNVPAYLMTTVRHLASAAGAGAGRETPRDPQGDERVEVPAQGGDPAEHVSSVDLVVRVLGQLPERWVKALWLAEAEGQPLAAIGPQLGTKEGATAVLLHRAREGMRQAFLQVQTGAPADPACQVHCARMPAYVRGSATARQSERLLGHVDACDDCRARLAALMSANDRLPALVGPALLVFAVGGTGKFLLTFLAGSAGSATTLSGAGGGLLDGVRHVTIGGTKSAVAAGAVVVGAAAVILALGPLDSGSVPPSQRTPVAEAPAVRIPVAEAPVDAGQEGGDDATSSRAAGVEGAEDVRVVGAEEVGATVAQARGDDDPAASSDGRTTDTPAPVETTPENPAPAPTEPTPPTKPTKPTKDTPEQPAPPTKDTPDQPAPPTKDTPEQPAPPAEPAPEQPAPPAEPAPEQPAPPAEPAPEQPQPPAPDAPEQPTVSTPEQPAEPEPTEPEPDTPAPAPAPAPDPAPADTIAPEPQPTDPLAPTDPGDGCGDDGGHAQG
ncbi:sigma-70 family RNA polymerase sigma factor [Streptomyces sp. RG80]|uniref:sigma-70 family RNA polymerase sigma factor n=1 Tax=Streptomyces sp. RG80 TaxID=3157340 RepID=UPI00338E9DF4